ncbi:GAF domain-containing protein [Sphingomonas gellani]|uniref:GAF domain-containing protein n=1 Tax=Sphingomonas gellani TaxID=1166340 RepID=A0A1H7YZS7_9SPHN|nr:GAF domain-containing protein [Sphingomonas gellani]
MDSANIESARSTFFGEGRLPVAAVRQPVLRSWIRCTELGLVQRSLSDLGPVPDSELRALQQRNDLLRRLCRPELELLAAEARESDSVVVLTDGDGMILDAIGDAAFSTHAARMALRPGVSWKEANTGTNAIGTALAERKPIAVHGGEHFFADHGLLSCAAVPIMDPGGVVVGALDMSGPSSVGNGHALGLVRMAVDQIEHRLFQRGFDGCRVLRFHDDPAMLGTSREGILVFRDTRLVAANRRGLSLVGRHWDALDECAIDDLLEERRSHGADLLMRLRVGTSAVGRWDVAGRTAHAPVASETALGTQPAAALADREAELIDAAVLACDGNVSQAARQLGIHRSTIHRHLRRRQAN